MKSTRPYRRARPDKNHSIVINALKNWGGGFSRDEFGVWQGHVRGLPVAAYNTSKLGGQLPDWLVAVNWMVIALEVKEARPVAIGKRANGGGSEQKLSDHEYYWSMLEPGEKAFFNHSPAVKYIVATEEEVWTKIIAAVEFVEYVDGFMHLESQPYLNIFFPKLREENQDEQFGNSFNN